MDQRGGPVLEKPTPDAGEIKQVNIPARQAPDLPARQEPGSEGNQVMADQPSRPGNPGEREVRG